MNLAKRNFQSGIRASLDSLISVFCLIFALPVMLILAIIIKFTDEGPVIYRQKRIGRFGKPFTIYKFRSMHIGTEEGIPLLSGPNDKRVTPIGAFMRKFKLDEIPNFINVLKGDMSLVGPRPEQQYFIEQILMVTPEYKNLHLIKPGVTSWGQVNYGYALDVHEMIDRMRYDLFYLENRSLFFDMKILFYTIGVIFKGERIKRTKVQPVSELALCT